jgi:hypothetical protein
VSSPFSTLCCVVGAKKMPKTSVEMVPWLKRLSVTVGTVSVLETVLWVRSVGPTPRIPSTPLKPCALEATPMLWPVMTRSGESVTVSRYSSPLTEPEPYETEKVLPVSWEVLVGL